MNTLAAAAEAEAEAEARAQAEEQAPQEDMRAPLRDMRDMPQAPRAPRTVLLPQDVPSDERPHCKYSVLFIPLKDRNYTNIKNVIIVCQSLYKIVI